MYNKPAKSSAVGDINISNLPLPLPIISALADPNVFSEAIPVFSCIISLNVFPSFFCASANCTLLLTSTTLNISLTALTFPK